MVKLKILEWNWASPKNLSAPPAIDSKQSQQDASERYTRIQKALSTILLVFPNFPWLTKLFTHLYGRSQLHIVLIKILKSLREIYRNCASIDRKRNLWFIDWYYGLFDHSYFWLSLIIYIFAFLYFLIFATFRLALIIVLYTFTGTVMN